jgi:hypothetical protein
MQISRENWTAGHFSRRTLAHGADIIRYLAVGETFLAAALQDGSVSVWNRRTFRLHKVNLFRLMEVKRHVSA